MYLLDPFLRVNPFSIYRKLRGGTYVSNTEMRVSPYTLCCGRSNWATTHFAFDTVGFRSVLRLRCKEPSRHV